MQMFTNLKQLGWDNRHKLKTRAVTLTSPSLKLRGVRAKNTDKATLSIVFICCMACGFLTSIN